MNAAFTIVAKNYIGLAKILRDSILRVNPEVCFYIVVADEPVASLKSENGVVYAKDINNISLEQWIDMSFKYTLTEFCTAIKPYCFEWLFSLKGIDNVIYFDPDIYVFNSLNIFYDGLTSRSIILVPHIIYPTDNDDNKETTFLQSGIFNLGFLALKNCANSKVFLKWWSKKLINACFDDLFDYTFTDQKWTNFIPALFPGEEILICRHPGANVAPWNFYEREVILKDGVPTEVRRRNSNENSSQILFIHYSGFNYRELLCGNKKRTRFGLYEMSYNDVEESILFYSNILRNNQEIIMEYLSLPYTYSCFSNGDLIEKFHRRLYRELSRREPVDNPFDEMGKLYVVLKKKKMLNRGGSVKLSDIKTYSTKRRLFVFNSLMIIVYKIIGVQRYISLLRLMKHFSRFESQIFLLNKTYLKSNINLLN